MGFVGLFLNYCIITVQSIEYFIGEIFLIITISKYFFFSSIQIFNFEDERRLRISQVFPLIFFLNLVMVIFFKDSLCYLIFGRRHVFLLLLIRLNIRRICIILIILLFILLFIRGFPLNRTLIHSLFIIRIQYIFIMSQNYYDILGVSKSATKD